MARTWHIMKRHGCNGIALLALSLWLFPAAWMAAGGPPDSAKVRRLFRDPPTEYSTGPLWVWNDWLTEEQLRDSLRDLARQGVKQVWVHPRPGLMTPYLGEDWFRLWKVALLEAARLDMKVWIYDENSYPSGFAGGLVPDAMPESRGRGLALREVKTPPAWSPDLVAVFRLSGAEYENVTAQARSGAAFEEGQYLVAAEVRSENSPWHGNRCYVNLLTPGVTEKFLEVTMEPYRRQLGKEFGRRVPGVFTDEPNIRPARGLPWAEDLPRAFERRWGYSLLAHLPSLSHPVGDWRKVRHNYYQLLHELFVERWARPNYEYCRTNRLEWTGHYWDHDWPDCRGVPDNMAMYAWHQRPAIDCLMNQYAEHTHAQFGNVRIVKELSSVANQVGWPRTLCEIYGAAGWDLRFEDMKRIGDWLEVLGVNTLNQHLTFLTLRGARKRDHPQSFSYHDPWWEAYHVSARYFARLSAALSQGQQINRVLVLEPTTTAWMYQGDSQQLNALGSAFFDLLMALEAAQIEYDLGCEDILASHGAPGGQTIQVNGKTVATHLKVGRREYHTVVLPPHTENLNRKTRELFERTATKRYTAGPEPSRVDGALLSDAQRPAAAPDPAQLSAWRDQLIADLRQRQQAEGFSIHRAANDRGILFHHRRQLPDGELLFLVNTSLEHPSRGTIESHLCRAEKWDLYTGKTLPYPATRHAAGLTAAFELPPSGSLLLLLSPKAGPAQFARETPAVLTADGPPKIRRLGPNMLTIDYVDVTAGGETKTNTYCYQAGQFVWKKNGWERNPWDSAVQFKDELIRRQFPADSGFEATYTFTVEGPVPSDLAIVIERADLYRVTCNGQLVTPNPKDWWLDKAFHRLPIASLARTGINRVTLQARPFSLFHELEPAYLLGSFTLRPTDRGFVVAPDQPLKLGRRDKRPTHTNNPDGTMWLSAGINFEKSAGDNRPDDRSPFLVFDLGREIALGKIEVYNYNESHIKNLTSRGVKRLRISGGTHGPAGAFNLDLGVFNLPKAGGGEEGGTVLELPDAKVRFVRFDILENHNGAVFPAEGEPPDNGFVGLAEVRFFARDGERVEPVSVAGASSELASRHRSARRLTDGSGMGFSRDGWNAQGHPFYSGGIAYSQRFNVTRRSDRYEVALPDWHGAVARVTVNGRLAGYVDAPPWTCDATRFIKRGSNEIEVTVIGTLKNLLGPHHGSPALGAAWPNAFHKGPDNGPPPGAQYHTVAYGMFEPFVLREIRRER